MNVKTTVTLSESTLREAEALVEKGEYASLSDLLEAGARQLIEQNHSEQDPVDGMADEIRRRMELPKDQWIPWDGDAILDRIRQRAERRRTK